ncbi:Deubiquitinase DESI2 (Desumoylating isopeptidase 2) (DeSI-2) (PPPDE peptidase domain-containing protein 1) (Protein FAM152A) [Durusdinium trenchii]|uniref:Deubiquitinase DESI2 (Desumoylating isopeptidase 2) (DeSI-2) (PPPDE peptidase domain-containing protein 1) (Protein FAM152A) n=1 Tax=Durusdinium trenchii TaxID=1381693 RepID=A0ABP0RE96_9DINO
MQSNTVGSRIPPPWAEVALSIYELHGASALNVLTRAANMGGAYHVGVEVYWLEWSFGWCEEGSGVYMVFPGQSSLGQFRERVPLGRTPLTPQEVFRILDMMRPELPGSNYDLLRCNCAHFSVAFVKRLRVSEAPAWVNSLANVGEHLVAQLGMAGAQEAADKATPAERERVAPKYLQFGDEEELEDLATEGDDLALRELAWRKAQAFVLEKASEAERDARTLDLAMELRCATDGDFQKISSLVDDLRLWQALAEACAAGFGLPCPYNQHQEAGGWSLLGDDEHSESEELEDRHSEDGACGNLEVYKLNGSQRLLTVRLRLRGKALDAKAAAPPWRGSAFREALRKAMAPQRGLTVRWPAGSQQIVSELEVVTAPDQALFGSRVETSCGPYAGKVLHSMAPRKMVHGGHDLVRMRKPEVVPPVLRVGQELQQWQSQQQQLWQSQQQQMPQWKWQVQQLQVQEPRGAARSARSAESARDHGNGAGGAVTLRSHRADPSDKVEHSLLKLQKIQQLDRLRREHVAR